MASDLEALRKQAVLECTKTYGLPINLEIDGALLQYEGMPHRVSVRLAFLILTYKREASTSELRKLSNQPAALIRDLRQSGFIFQDNGSGRYFYKNASGEMCRKIIGYTKPDLEIKTRTKGLFDKSISACLSAIEVYNRPDFKYREETFAILMVNAWELIVKAKVLLDNNDRVESIQATDSNGVIKRNRSGNPLTIDIMASMNKLVTSKTLDSVCQKNIELLIEIRDNAIHYINRVFDFSKKVQEIGTASIRNYVTVIQDWFGRDLSKYNLFLMPISFFNIEDVSNLSIKSEDKELRKLLSFIIEMEDMYPYDESNPYSISLQIKTRFVKVDDDHTLRVKYSNDPTAPEIRVSEDNVFESKYPLSYRDLVDKLKKRYKDFKMNTFFYNTKNKIMAELGEKVYRIRYLDIKQNSSSNKTYYSPEIIKEFDKYYTR